MLEFFFSPQGRIGRTRFWLCALANGLAVFGCITLLSMLASQASANHGSLEASGMGVPILALGGVVLLLSMWCTLCAAIKRYHDRGKSGWWLLVSLIPVVGWLWYLIETGLLPGEPRSNQYGADRNARAPSYAETFS